MSTLPNVRTGRAEALVRAPARPVEIANRCALCAEGTTRTLFQVDGTFIVECRDCGLVRQETRPLAAAAIYDSEYYATDNPKGGYANYFLDSDVNRRTFRDRIRAIEHLADPVATLAAVRRLLVPGGIVHLVTPNVGGLQARLLGRLWYHYKPGEHLFYFSHRTLRAVCEAAGLRWDGWQRSASYLTFTYCFNRMRYYAPAPFAFLEWLGRTFRFGPYAFRVPVGEMEAWAQREEPTGS